MKIAVITLGCPKNLVDTEVILGLLSDAGHEFAAETGCADLIIVSTCSFISAAVDESRRVVEECLELKRDGVVGRVLVAGCLPQRYGRRTFEMLPGVDGVVGSSEFQRIAEAVEEVQAGHDIFMVGTSDTIYDERTPRILATPSHLAYVKIADGCDNCCSYCTIPSIRGRLRSRPIASIVEEVNDLVAGGVREINLIAQDTTAYGTDIASDVTLPRLLTALAGTGVPWIRILYTHPAHITEELMRVMADTDAVVPYLDVPIQHVSDRVLRTMGRGTSGDEVRRVLARLREQVPGVAVRSSVMVGFPGERDEDYRELLGFVREGWIDHLGTFEYSPEPGTEAFELPDRVDGETTSARARELVDTMGKLSDEKGRTLVGHDVTVLVDREIVGAERPTVGGRTSRHCWEIDGEVVVEVEGELPEPGSFVQARVTEACGFGLKATARVD